MVNLNLFKDRLFTGSVLTVTTGFIFLIGVMVLLPQFLTNFQHKTELQAALLITPVSAAIFVFSNLAGLLTKKIGYTIPVILGFGIMGIAYYLLHNLTIDSTSKEIILLCSLLGLGFSFIISSATIASTSSFEGEMLTASQGVFSMLRQVGVVLAVAIFVAGLTNNIGAKKQDVVYFAAQELEKLNVPQTAKEKISSETRKSINASKNYSRQTNPNEITAAERQQIIDLNVQKALADIPEEQRPKAKEQIYQKVEKQVDKDIALTGKLVKVYEKQISNYGQTTIASSFTDLYKASIPFVLLSCLTGIVFIERKRKSAVPIANTSVTE